MNDEMYNLDDYLEAIGENPNMSALERAIWAKKLFDPVQAMPPLMRDTQVGLEAIDQAEDAGYNAIQDTIHNEMRHNGYVWDTYDDFGRRHEGEFSIPNTNLKITTRAGNNPQAYNVIGDEYGGYDYMGPQLIDDEFQLADFNKMRQLAQSPRGWMHSYDFDTTNLENDPELNQWKYIKPDFDTPNKIMAASVHNEVSDGREGNKWLSGIPYKDYSELLNDPHWAIDNLGENALEDYEAHQPLNEWGQLVNNLRNNQGFTDMLGTTMGGAESKPLLDGLLPYPDQLVPEMFGPGEYDEAKIKKLVDLYHQVIDGYTPEVSQYTRENGVEPRRYQRMIEDVTNRQSKLAQAMGMERAFINKEASPTPIAPNHYISGGLFKIPNIDNAYLSLLNGFPDLQYITDTGYVGYPNIEYENMLNPDKWAQYQNQWNQKEVDALNEINDRRAKHMEAAGDETRIEGPRTKKQSISDFNEAVKSLSKLGFQRIDGFGPDSEYALYGIPDTDHGTVYVDKDPESEIFVGNTIFGGKGEAPLLSSYPAGISLSDLTQIQELAKKLNLPAAYFDQWDENADFLGEHSNLNNWKSMPSTLNTPERLAAAIANEDKPLDLSKEVFNYPDQWQGDYINAKQGSFGEIEALRKQIDKAKTPQERRALEAKLNRLISESPFKVNVKKIGK